MAEFRRTADMVVRAATRSKKRAMKAPRIDPGLRELLGARTWGL
jgi:hypothetical protein